MELLKENRGIKTIFSNWMKELSCPSIRIIFPWLLMLILNVQLCDSAGWDNRSEIVAPVLSTKDLIVSKGHTAKLKCIVRTCVQVNVSFYYQDCERLKPKPKCQRLTSLRDQENTKFQNRSCKLTYEVSFVPEQSGIFTCAAKYSNVEMKQSTAQVFLVENMTLVRDSHEENGMGDRLTCKAMSVLFDGNLRWYRNGVEITESNGFKIVTTQEHHSVQSTVFLNLGFQVNNYTYECRAYHKRDIRKYDSRKISVEVDLRAPRWISYNMTKNLSIELMLFETLKLECDANATSNFRVHWFKDKKELTETNRTRIVEANSKLLIRRLSFWDSGLYTCQVENEFGRIKRSVTVTILELLGPYELYWALFGLACLVLIIFGIFLMLNWIINCARKKFRECDKAIVSPNDTAYEEPLPPITSSEIPFSVVSKAMYKSINQGRVTAGTPKKKFREGDVTISSPNESTYEQADPLSFTKRLEISKDDLSIVGMLGSGAFGVVCKAYVRNIYPGELTKVAVKTLKATDTQSQTALIKELQVMVHVGRHLNIINLLGVVTKGKILVVLEYCHYGSIEDILKQNASSFINQICPKTDIIVPNSQRMLKQSILDVCQMTSKQITQVTTIDLVSWAFQVACGMEYLQSKKVFHGDLAARNILLAQENVVKICDFGLARMMCNDQIYKKSEECKLPIRWLAPESLKHVEFSNYSDVWSFGIVLWEMFSLAQTPYPQIHKIDLFQFLQMLESGHRMEKPIYANNQVHGIMVQCWHIRPEMRPSFSLLKAKLANILDSTTVNHYDFLNQEHRTYNEQNAISQPDIGLSDFPLKYSNIHY